MAALTKEQRDALIGRHEALWTEYVAGVRDDMLTPEQELERQRELERLLGQYFDGLPRLPLSRCPICDREFQHSFDPWGVDGYWWQEQAAKPTPEPEPCAHFGVMQGALDLRGLPPRGGVREEANVGPAVPFVIPRLLELRSVTAVISQIGMKNGYTAYPIVYYTSVPLPPGSFTQPWTRGSYSWPNGRGGYGWRVDTDPWDFELERWIRADRVLWIDPADESRRVRSRSAGACPFVGLPGKRERQYILGDVLWTKPSPHGEGIDPFAQ